MMLKLQPMAMVPRDRPVLILTNQGIISAWYSKGEWHDYQEGSEYDGPVWVCYDDETQIEIEEFGQELSDENHPGCLGWYDLSEVELPPGFIMPSKEAYEDEKFKQAIKTGKLGT